MWAAGATRPCPRARITPAKTRFGWSENGYRSFSGNVQFAHMPTTPGSETVTRMEHGGRWRYGNIHVDRRVAVDIEPSMPDGGYDQEDLTTIAPPAPATPVSMAHIEQYADGDWVEASDELTGTAVF